MSDHDYLLQALKLAELRRGFCAPNPSVGAIVVRDQHILATGYHLGSGHPHAEADALMKLKAGDAKGATLYVTLEPCCHTAKKTPPCTELIKTHGIARVIYAHRDPNPQVSGKGEAALNAAGIVCEQLTLAEMTDFYKSYDFWWKTRRPFVTVKIAQSLNGVIAGKAGEPLQITGNALQELTHQQRLTSDALLTTVKTISQDDPQLNVRLKQSDIISKPLYILDSQLRLPLNARIWETAAQITLFHNETVDPARKEALLTKGAHCVAVPNTLEGLDLNAVLAHIGQAGIHDLWVEAGGHCVTSLLHARLIQRLLVYIAPCLLEGQRFAMDIRCDTITPEQTKKWYIWGDDVLCDIHFL